MQVESTISPKFIEGFVEQCLNMDLDATQTETLFQKHAYNQVIGRPHVYDGFRSVIGHYEGPLTKSAMTRWLNPDMIALAEETRLHYGDDPLSEQTRAALGLPEPSWDTVPDHIKSAASDLSGVIDQYDYLPLNQKILLAILAGSSLGGLSRSLLPTQEDKVYRRGLFNRATRGVLRGAGTSAGIASGAAAGSDIAGSIDPGLRLPAMMAGGALGGLAGRHLSSQVVS